MKKSLTTVLSLLLIFSVFAQETIMELSDSSNLKKCKFDQQYDYENFIDPFPPKKKNNWSIGLGIGSPVLLADVRPLLLQSIGGDIEVRKAFSHVFSLRYQGIMAMTKGVNYRSHKLDGSVAPLNYRTVLTDNSLQAVFTLNNINFHKKQPKVGFNVFAGLGVTSSFTKHNLLDENGNAYDYSNLSNIETFGDRSFVVNEIQNLLDDGFETIDKAPKGKASINDNLILPSFIVGAGLDFYLSKRVDLSLESRVSRHLSDNLDGYTLGKGEDWFMYSSIGFNFKIGKNSQPLYWDNPLATGYTDIMNLKQGNDPSTSFQDLDQDGVIDIFDKDLNTPMGVEVTTTGVALDTDKDGVPNFRDKEIYSPEGAKVDAFGRAIDSDGDGIADILDLEAKTPAGSFVDINGRAINGGNSNSTTNNSNVLFLKGVDIWSIFFDSDDYRVKTDYHPIILNLASYMIENKAAVLVLTGYTDSKSSEEYNLELSKKRANSVLAYFTKLGINSDRFVIQFKGEQEPLVDQPTSPLSLQLNRRVTLKFK